MNKIYIVNKYFNIEIELNFIEKKFYIDNIDYTFNIINNILYIYWLSDEIEEYYTDNSYIYYSHISLKNNIQLIYLIHNDWFDQVIINNTNNTLRRILYNNEYATFNFENKELFSEVQIKENSILKIKWNNWNIVEEFIKIDNYTFSNNTMNLSERSVDKELFSGMLVKENTMNLSERSVDNSTNNTKNITNKSYIFIHICCIENWKDIFIEQINSIKDSGLYKIITKIHLCILGNINIIKDDIFNDDKFNIIYVDSRIYLYEILTINSIKSFCDRIDEEIYILYIHTKGVRRAGNDIIIKSWRNMMEYFLIFKFKECLHGLNELNYDTLGNNILNSKCVDEKYVNINPNHNLHYSGNFWWSKKSYIDKLDYIPINLSKTSDYTRFKAENWILSNYPETNIGVIFQDNTNIHPYYRYVYDYYKEMIFNIKKYNISI